MKKYLTVVIICLTGLVLNGQGDHRMLPSEQFALPMYHHPLGTSNPVVSSVTPPVSPVRTIGEWEELQGFAVTWTSYTSMIREIIRAARLETKVYVVCSNAQTVINSLLNNAIDTSNVVFVVAPYNSVWMRDYGPWSAYTNQVDSLITIDWIYNRPRPNDDLIPGVLSGIIGTPLYQTTTAPWDLVHTGGNFMTDGYGTGFSSNLILTENSTAGGFGVNHTASEIDTIMKKFMGIDRYILMPTLPYDVIHHIDMHLKLLDEETLLVGQYPQGIADGPQIEANLQYILANYNSVYGTPYKVIRIPMPPDNGTYPNTTGNYYTYTNASFINKTIIVPTYGLPQDSTALRIFRDALPGYKVVGINSSASIGALGALHCITKEIGTSDPLLVQHQPLHDTTNTTVPYSVVAKILHRSGISSASVWYRTDTLLPYQQVLMGPVSGGQWAGNIPPQPVGTTIYYYIEANSVSGKTRLHPLSAPDGYWKFKIVGTTGLNNISTFSDKLDLVYPNPCKGITCIPFELANTSFLNVTLTNILSQSTRQIFSGQKPAGKGILFFDASTLASGIYLLRFETERGAQVQKIVVR